LEKHLLAKSWQEARTGIQVKLLAQEGELYVLAQSRDRVAKERAMRRRQLKRLWARLKQLSTMPLTREELLMKLGAARDQSRTAWRLAAIEIAADSAAFSYRLDRNKLARAEIGANGGLYPKQSPAQVLNINLIHVAADVFAHVVLSREVAGWENSPQAAVIAGFAGNRHCSLVDWLAEGRLEGRGVDLRDMEMNELARSQISYITLRGVDE
jgi:hypothetical protein